MKNILFILSVLAFGQTTAFASRANPHEMLGTYEIVETNCNPPGGPCNQFASISTTDIRLTGNGLVIAIGPWRQWYIDSPNCDVTPSVPNVCHEEYYPGGILLSSRISIEKTEDGLYKLESFYSEYTPREGVTGRFIDTLILRKVQ